MKHSEHSKYSLINHAIDIKVHIIWHPILHITNSTNKQNLLFAKTSQPTELGGNNGLLKII